MKHSSFAAIMRLLLVLISTIIIVNLAFADAPFTDLFNFSYDAGGFLPFGGLVTDGTNLYGTTSGNAPIDGGTVFELSPSSNGSWTETVLYKFSSVWDGAGPVDSLIRDSKGNLYGTTNEGGNVNSYCGSGCGTVFELSPPTEPGGAWTLTTLYRFKGGTDGAESSAPLIMDEKGNLYGTTTDGGMVYTCCGTAFMLSPPTTPGGSWTETVLHDFGIGNDGTIPVAGLYRDSQGNLYGTTQGGGGRGPGSVFRLAPPSSGGTWTETILYAFTGGTDGGAPGSALVRYKDSLYGTAASGGDLSACDTGLTQGCGVVYQLTAERNGTWSFAVLHAFTGSTDGSSPKAGLVVDPSGNLYGATLYGGDNSNPTCRGTYYQGCGVVFELSPKNETWTENVLHTFEATDGYEPIGTLLASHGALWGMTLVGGNLSSCSPEGCGVVFKVGP
jgi:uncharacterized repeat protein (TIGR03803 family)